MFTKTEHYVRATQLADVLATGSLVIYIEGHTLLLCSSGDKIYAVDNRCPHMGFPLHQGTVKDCILTCDWHHARFDLTSGGTFDSWADDVRAFPVEIRDGEVWVDLAPKVEPENYHRQRLTDGLEQGISLVIAKSAIAMLDSGVNATEPFRIGLNFGARYRNKRGSMKAPVF